MRHLLYVLTALAACLAASGATPAAAQAVPKSLQENRGDDVAKQRKNNWTVGIVGGQIDGTYMRFADELAKALDDGDNLRILPNVSYGAASNLDDLLYLRGVDVAVTQADVFEYFRTERKTANLDQRINYIIRLPIAEMHVLARNDIKTMEDLRGKKVSFGPAGSASSLTGSIVFQRLGIQVEPVSVDNPSALQKLKSGEVAALVRVIGKPVDFFTRIPAEAGLHLLSIPFSKAFADYYTLAVYNWPKSSDRYRRIERFTEQLFTKFEKFQQPSFHPKWRDINLAATVPGWKRFSAADDMLQRVSGNTAESRDQLNKSFQMFLAQTKPASAAASPNASDQDALFREFLSWRAKQSGTR
jgi:TRAP-type uncharacterized transport system substrate-binding protein